MDILGIRVDNFSKEEILEKIGFFLDEPRFHQIATVNAEFVLEARKNEEFKKILNECDLNVADTISIQYAFLRYGNKLICRFAGADLLLEILKITNYKNLGIFLAIRKDGLSSLEEIKSAIHNLYPSLDVEGMELDMNDNSQKIPDIKCRILICNFGAPNQEIFLKSQKNDIIRLAIGVGGSFDFMTGKIRRAPVFWRKIGLEWLWRFLQEPKYRLKRVFNATVVFPFLVIFNSKK